MSLPLENFSQDSVNRVFSPESLKHPCCPSVCIMSNSFNVQCNFYFFQLENSFYGEDTSRFIFSTNVLILGIELKMKLLNSEQSKFKNPKRPKKHFFSYQHKVSLKCTNLVIQCACNCCVVWREQVKEMTGTDELEQQCWFKVTSCYFNNQLSVLIHLFGILGPHRKAEQVFEDLFFVRQNSSVSGLCILFCWWF